MTEDRGQRTEDRGQTTDDRGQRTEDRGQRTEEIKMPKTVMIPENIPVKLVKPLGAHLDLINLGIYGLIQLLQKNGEVSEIIIANNKKGIEIKVIEIVDTTNKIVKNDDPDIKGMRIKLRYKREKTKKEVKR